MGTSRSKKRKTSPINGDGKAAIDTSPVQPEGLTQVGPKRRPWATEEDDNLRQLVGVHGVKNWALIATELHMRNGKQVRWGKLGACRTARLHLQMHNAASCGGTSVACGMCGPRD